MSTYGFSNMKASLKLQSPYLAYNYTEIHDKYCRPLKILNYRNCHNVLLLTIVHETWACQKIEKCTGEPFLYV